MIKDFENIYWKNFKQELAFRHISSIKLIENLDIETFLDVGSGDGFFIEFLKNKFSIVWEWFELSEQGVVNAQKRGIISSQIDIHDPHAIEQYINKFDLVTCLDVLEHMLEPEKALKNMQVLTKKYLIISIPNFNSITARIQVLLWKVPENNTPRKWHCFWFNKKVIDKMLHDEWFKIISMESNTLQFLNKLWIGNLLLKLFPWLFSLSFTILCEKIS